MSETPVIVDAHGKPARAAVSRACPQCGAGPDARVPSAGFGHPHPVCGRCGYEWHAERWEG
jgi:uncharacterized protein (DUF983 family)